LSFVNRNFYDRGGADIGITQVGTVLRRSSKLATTLRADHKDRTDSPKNIQGVLS
jgi:hypothetical protein